MTYNLTETFLCFLLSPLIFPPVTSSSESQELPSHTCCWPLACASATAGPSMKTSSVLAPKKLKPVPLVKNKPAIGWISWMLGDAPKKPGKNLYGFDETFAPAVESAGRTPKRMRDGDKEWYSGTRYQHFVGLCMYRKQLHINHTFKATLPIVLTSHTCTHHWHPKLNS